MGFNFAAIQAIEFGVCLDAEGGEIYRQIPVDVEVQGALKEILDTTREALGLKAGELEAFEPAQKYSATERLVAELDSPYMEKIKGIYSAENLEVSAQSIKETASLAFYFIVFRDSKDEKLLAVRRAMQFKGVLKARNRLISLIDDTLQLVGDDVFKLDNDFDYLVFDNKVCIYRPTGFEFTAGIENEIAAKALEMTAEVAKSISCVDFTDLSKYVSKHRRAARLIASLRARDDLHLTSPAKLKKGCKQNGIEFTVSKGKIIPADGQELAFLELLDRRRYNVSLIEEQDEFYVAGSRHQAK
jgi:hypothetical protein